MSKRKGPALYELISASKASEQAQDSAVPSPQEHDVDLDRNVLAPGRSIRMSVGTMGVAAAVCIALIIISFTMGYQKGMAIGEQARDDYGVRLQESFEEPSESIAGNSATSTHSASTGQKSSWGPILSDPRNPDFYHFVLINTRKDGALQLATFCREKGLETYVVSGHNTGFFNVVAFPGSQDTNAPELKFVQSKIHAIGQEWADSEEGQGKDLQDAYLIR